MSIKHRLKLITRYFLVILKWPIYNLLKKFGEILIRLELTNLLTFFFGDSRTKFLGIRIMVPLRDIRLTEEAKEKINETSVFLDEVINQGIEVKNSHEYKKMIKYMELGSLPKGCSSEYEVIGYFQNLLEVFDNINTNGFQIDRRNRISDLKQVSNIHLISLLPIPHEIMVKVDSNGAVNWLQQGLHRQAIAKFLDIDSIPVYVFSCDRLFISSIIQKRLQGNVIDS